MESGEPVDQRDSVAASADIWLFVVGVALVMVGLVGLVVPGVPGLLFLGPGVLLAAAGLAVRVRARRADPVSRSR